MRPSSYSLRSNRLRGRREEAWSTHHNKYCIDIPRTTAKYADKKIMHAFSVDPEYRLDIAKIYGENRTDVPLIVEIGSGLGETVANASRLHPDHNYLAVEVFTPGLASTIIKLEQQRKPNNGKATSLDENTRIHTTHNVRLVQADATKLLDTALPARSVSELWIFFPDPWPKRRHHKRRLLHKEFLDLAARVLIPDGLLRLASDWDHYALTMREICEADTRFTNEHPEERPGRIFRIREIKGRPGGAATQEILLEEDSKVTDTIGGWAPRFRERPITSYEKKAHQAGRNIHDLTYRLTTR